MGIKIFIEYKDNITEYKVKNNTKLFDVKKFVGKKYHLSNFELSYKNELLDDKMTISYYNINKNDLLKIIELKYVIVIIIFPNEKKIKFKMEGTNKIKDTKNNIEKQEKIPLKRQILKFKKNIIKDEELLSNFKHSLIFFELCFTKEETIQINVETPFKKILTMKVDILDTIEQVHNKIKYKDLPSTSYKLTFKGKRISYYNFLNDLNIKNGDTLQYAEFSDNYIAISKENSDNHEDKVYLTIEYSDSIYDLKKIINDRLKIPIFLQKIKLNGKILDDHKAIDECLVENDNINMIKYETISKELFLSEYLLNNEKVTIYVKLFNKREISLIVSLLDKIEDIHKKIEEKGKISLWNTKRRKI